MTGYLPFLKTEDASEALTGCVEIIREREVVAENGRRAQEWVDLNSRILVINDDDVERSMVVVQLVGSGIRGAQGG